MSREDSNENTYLSFSPEVLHALNQNHITIEKLLEKAGVDGLKLVPDPAAAKGQREVLMILLGSAALTAAATPLITNIIKTFVNKPVILQNRALTPILDKNGEVTRDKDGQPVMKWSYTETLDRPETSENLTGVIKATKTGIEIGIG